MKKYAVELKWGILFSLLSIVWMIVEKTVGLHDKYIDKQAIYTNLFAIVAFIIYFLALIDKKKSFNNGEMTWKQGFISGIVLSFVISLLNPLVQYIISVFITPDYFANAIKNAVDKKHMTQTVADSYYSLKSFILQGTSGGLSMGVITGAIVAYFVQTKNNTNEK